MRAHLRYRLRVGDERRDDVVPPEGTQVMLALLRVYERQHRATIGEVAVEAGVSRGNAHKHLTHLFRAGLVGMGRAGMLRPLVARVDVPRRTSTRRRR